MLGRRGAPAVFQLTGGPGVSNLRMRYPAALLEGFRIVEVGYRGLDSHPALDARPLQRALSSPSLCSVPAKEALAAAFSTCVRRWLASGFDLAGYQMSDIVADLEQVRSMLGLGRVHLLAQSY